LGNSESIRIKAFNTFSDLPIVLFCRLHIIVITPYFSAQEHTIQITKHTLHTNKSDKNYYN